MKFFLLIKKDESAITDSDLSLYETTEKETTEKITKLQNDIYNRCVS